MDTLRSCYRTMMRFPGVGVVPVQWYFTDKPPLDKEHVYGSHNHIREQGDDDYDTGEPGEVWGASRQWANGVGPVQDFCAGPFGSDNSWIGEPELDAPTIPSALWGAEYDDSHSEGHLSTTYMEGHTGTDGP